MARQAKAVVLAEGDRDRKRTILRAAVEVFATKGYHGCRIADIAREAGVAYGLVYHYFENKEELLQAVFKLGFESLAGRLRELTISPGSFPDRVRAIVDYAFDAYRAEPKLVRVLILQIARSPTVGGMNRYSAFGEIIRLSVEMFAEGQRCGEVHSEADPKLAAAMLFGIVEMGLTSMIVGLADSSDEAAFARAKQQVADTFLSGVLRTPRHPHAVRP